MVLLLNQLGSCFWHTASREEKTSAIAIAVVCKRQQRGRIGQQQKEARIASPSNRFLASGRQSAAVVACRRRSGALRSHVAPPPARPPAHRGTAQGRGEGATSPNMCSSSVSIAGGGGLMIHGGKGGLGISSPSGQGGGQGGGTGFPGGHGASLDWEINMPVMENAVRGMLGALCDHGVALRSQHACAGCKHTDVWVMLRSAFVIKTQHAFVRSSGRPARPRPHQARQAAACRCMRRLQDRMQDRPCCEDTVPAQKQQCKQRFIGLCFGRTGGRAPRRDCTTSNSASSSASFSSVGTSSSGIRSKSLCIGGVPRTAVSDLFIRSVQQSHTCFFSPRNVEHHQRMGAHP